MILATLPAHVYAAVVDPYRLITTIQGPVLPPKGDTWAFDLSWVDGLHHRYYLADAANRRVDVVDTRSNHLITTIDGFTGVQGTSGKFRQMRPGEVQNWLHTSFHPLYRRKCLAKGKSQEG